MRSGVDMADPDTLAQFVARTLDNAERTGAKQTWINLVDHGADDGGGLEARLMGERFADTPLAKLFIVPESAVK